MANGIKISLLSPSLKRAKKLSETLKEWISLANEPDKIEILIGLDDIDPTIAEYYNEFYNLDEIKNIGRFEINVGPTRSTIQSCNRLSKTISTSSELLIVVADDHGCIPLWDLELFNILKNVDNFKDPKYIAVSDGIWNKNNITPLTFCPYYFVNRAFYNKLGYIHCEEYESMYADNDLYEVSKQLDCIIDARHLYFEHRHWSTDKSNFDETYAKTSTQNSFDIGKIIFEKRKSRNFDLEV